MTSLNVLKAPAQTASSVTPAAEPAAQGSDWFHTRTVIWNNSATAVALMSDDSDHPYMQQVQIHSGRDASSSSSSSSSSSLLRCNKRLKRTSDKNKARIYICLYSADIKNNFACKIQQNSAGLKSCPWAWKLSHKRSNGASSYHVY